MTANAREWGIALIRIWMGFLIGLAGFGELKGTALVQLFSIWKSPAAILGAALPSLVLLLGGTAIFLGIAVRIASLATALVTAYFLLGRGGFPAGGLSNGTAVKVTFLVASVAFILTGPGRLNLGVLLARRR